MQKEFIMQELFDKPKRKTKIRKTNISLIFVSFSFGLESVERVLYPFKFHQTDNSNISLSTNFQSNVESHCLHMSHV